VQSAGSSINSGSGKFSQGGCDPGFRQTSYTSGVNVNDASYNNLLTAVLRNSSVGSKAQLDTLLAATNPYTINGYKFYSYTTLPAISDTTKINVLVPASGITSQTITGMAVSADVKVVAFINGSLTANGNVTTSTGNSSAIFILTGDLTVNSAVTRLDGIYIFPGVFSDGFSANQLTGYGSLLNTGTLPLGFQRYFTPGPAEQWFYQPKYLNIYKNVLATPKYTWSEQLPE